MDSKYDIKFSGNGAMPEEMNVSGEPAFNIGAPSFIGPVMPKFEDMSVKGVKDEPPPEGTIRLLPVMTDFGDGRPSQMQYLEYRPKELLTMLNEGKNSELTTAILEILRFFGQQVISTVTHEDLEGLRVLAKLLLLIISDERFQPPENKAPLLLFGNITLSNLVQLTEFGTTDIFLKKVLDQKNNIVKVLTLYTMRNKLEIDLEPMFAVNPQLVSIWWVHLMDQTRNCNSEHIYKRMYSLLTDKGALKHFCIADNDYQVFDNLTHPVFLASYIAPEYEPVIKKKVNDELKKIALERKPHPNPDMKKILVVSWVFRKRHAVYKAMAPLLRSLKGHYKLYYLSLDPAIAENSPVLDRDLFDEVWPFFQDDSHAPRQDSYQKVMNEDYGIVLIPDVGMNFNSLMFANTRLAPIQITTYGHPVSTYASEMDYFIGGQAVETPNKPEQYYSERLVLIPGIASQPVYSDYELVGAKADTDRFLISCSWGSIKVYYPLLQQLKEIVKRSEKKICFFFSGITGNNFNLITFRKDMGDLLGAENVNVSQIMKHDDYMKCIEVCEFGIDAYPFGSFNRVVDTLVAQKPLITMQGERAYNRMASAVVRELGFEEMVATTYDEYVEKSLRLIHDDAYRLDLVDRIKKTDLKAVLFSTGKEKYFKKAIDYIVENDSRLKKEKSRKPIVISED